MWTNKQIWEFEQLNENLTFDMIHAEHGSYEIDSWKSKRTHLGSDLRDVTVKTFDHLLDGEELWIADKNQGKLDEKNIAYLMAVIADVMVEEEVCLNFAINNDCLVVSIDGNADVIDCKEFFEEFYHLATGFNYDTDTGFPKTRQKQRCILQDYKKNLIKK